MLRDLLSLIKKSVKVFQWFNSRILGDNGLNFFKCFLDFVNGFLVWSNNSSDFQSTGTVQQSVGPIGQLFDDHIPKAKALVARSTVWENSRISSGTFITTESFYTLIADAVAIRSITLRCLYTPRVTITS